MIIKNLTKFNESLMNSSLPLFQIEAILAIPDITLHLNAREMTKLFLQSVRDCIEWYLIFLIFSFLICLV